MQFLAQSGTMQGAVGLPRGPSGKGRRAGQPHRAGRRRNASHGRATPAERSSQGEDAELVRRAAAGDAEAFRRLTVRYYRPVGGFLLKRVHRPDVVEDLVQETFLEAYRSLKAGRRPEHFSSWLFGVAHNCCGKWLRRKRPMLFDPSRAPDMARFRAMRSFVKSRRSSRSGWPTWTGRWRGCRRRRGDCWT